MLKQGKIYKEKCPMDKDMFFFHYIMITFFNSQDPNQTLQLPIWKTPHALHH